MTTIAERDEHGRRDVVFGQDGDAVRDMHTKNALVDRDRLDRDHVAQATGEEHRGQRGDERLDRK